MVNRLELQSKLEELLGSGNVYYNPPESKKMEYDAIRYSKKNITSRFANNAAYSFSKSYEVIVISRKPDPEVIDKLLSLPYCSFDRYYRADNLHHNVFTLYY